MGDVANPEIRHGRRQAYKGDAGVEQRLWGPSAIGILDVGNWRCAVRPDAVREHIVTVVSDIVERHHGLGSQGLLQLQVPLDVGWIENLVPDGVVIWHGTR